MASRQSTVDYVVEQIGDAGAASARKMFGEYGVYLGGKMIALICGDELFLKPTAGGSAFIGEAVEKAPYKGAKPCYLVSAERWDDRDWMSRLAVITANELPEPKRKSR